MDGTVEGPMVNVRSRRRSMPLDSGFHYRRRSGFGQGDSSSVSLALARSIDSAVAILPDPLSSPVRTLHQAVKRPVLRSLFQLGFLLTKFRF
jgi:hypothetical protein